MYFINDVVNNVVETLSSPPASPSQKMKPASSQEIVEEVSPLSLANLITAAASPIASPLVSPLASPLTSPSSSSASIHDPTWEKLMNDDIMMCTLTEGLQSSQASMGKTVLCKYIKGFIIKPKKTEENNTNSTENENENENGNENNTIDDERIYLETLENLKVTIGESDVIPALELSLRNSQINQKFIVKSTSKFAYGLTGRPQIVQKNGENESVIIPAIPPYCDIEYEVEVSGHFDNALCYQPSSSLSSSSSLSVPSQIEFVLAEVNLRKESGNRWFSFKDFSRAGISYSKGMKAAELYLESHQQEGVGAVVVVEDLSDNTDDSNSSGSSSSDNSNLKLQMRELNSAYTACLNNLAAVYISTSQFQKARDLCIGILTSDPTNIKALLRAAKASLAMDDYDDCELCLQTVFKHEPENTIAMEEKKKLEMAKKNYAIKSKSLAKQMAKKLFGDNSSNNSSNINSSINISNKNDNTNSNTDKVHVISEKEGNAEEKNNLPLPLSVGPELTISEEEKNEKENKEKNNKRQKELKDEEEEEEEEEEKEIESENEIQLEAETMTSGDSSSIPPLTIPSGNHNTVLLLFTSLITVIISIFVVWYATHANELKID